jgi:predicted membrane metal-binding protein
LAGADLFATLGLVRSFRCTRSSPGIHGPSLLHTDRDTIWSRARWVFVTRLCGLLFQNRASLLAGWVRYLAFDLFVGSWEVRDAQQIGITHCLVIPCLLLTFLFGPAGWLFYLLIRTVALRNTWIGSGQERDKPEIAQ